MSDGASGMFMQTLQDPWCYVAVVAVGIIVFGLRALIRGDLRTGREAEALLKRAEAAEATTRVRDEQVGAIMAAIDKIAVVLEKFHIAGREIQQAQEEVEAEAGEPS